MNIIKRIKSIFSFKEKTKPIWRNHLIRCPSQSDCFFKVGDKRYAIYLRWRHSDPWTAQIIPLLNEPDSEGDEFDYKADWVELDINYYTHDKYKKLQKECEKIIKKMFKNLEWI